MPDRDAFEPLAAGEETRNVVIAEIARQPRIDAGFGGPPPPPPRPPSAASPPLRQ